MRKVQYTLEMRPVKNMYCILTFEIINVNEMNQSIKEICYMKQQNLSNGEPWNQHRCIRQELSNQFNYLQLATSCEKIGKVLRNKFESDIFWLNQLKLSNGELNRREIYTDIPVKNYNIIATIFSSQLHFHQELCNFKKIVKK